MDQVVREFKGTKLGSQELYGEILSETQGALWQRASIVYSEPLYDAQHRPLLSRIVVAIDPATTHHDGSDETGIIVAGVDDKGCGYVLEDLSGKHSPLDWGQRAVAAYHRYKADRIVAEVNKGGDLVERVIRSIDSCASYKEVRATRGKAVRAEPVAALYEKGRIFHSRPLHLLEEQMCSYIPGSTSKSPDRVDALVWAFTDLLLVGEASAQLKIWGA
jgi:phage terminase large subunit-like protein